MRQISVRVKNPARSVGDAGVNPQNLGFRGLSSICCSILDYYVISVTRTRSFSKLSLTIFLPLFDSLWAARQHLLLILWAHSLKTTFLIDNLYPDRGIEASIFGLRKSSPLRFRTPLMITDYLERFLIEAARPTHWNQRPHPQQWPPDNCLLRPNACDACLQTTADSPAPDDQIMNVMLRTETAQHLANRYQDTNCWARTSIPRPRLAEMPHAAPRALCPRPFTPWRSSLQTRHRCRSRGSRSLVGADKQGRRCDQMR